MSKKIPYKEWRASMTDAEYKAYKSGQRAAKASGTRGRKPYSKSSKRTTTQRKPYVKGKGPYFLGGSIGYDSQKGFSASGRGYVTDAVVEGHGPYNVKSNSLMGAIDLGQPIPRVSNTNRGEAFVINHKEYLGDLYSDGFVVGTSGTSFNLQSYNLNPGNSKMFPFLSTIAKNFQEYEIRGMLIWLKPLASDYSASMTLGAVFASADYNVYGDTPTTKVQVENMEYSQSSKPSAGIIMPIECEAQNNGSVHKKVAIDDQYHGGDKNNFDWAHVFIGSQGVPVEHTPLAEIHLTYEVAFFKGIVNQNDPKLQSTWDGAAWRLVSPSGSTPVGTSLAPFLGNSADITLDITAQKLTFPTMHRGDPDRYFIVSYQVSNTGAVGSYVIGSTASDHLDQVVCWSQAGLSNSTWEANGGFNTSSNQVLINMIFRCKADITKATVNPYFSWGTNWAMAAGTRVGVLVAAALPATFDPEVQLTEEEKISQLVEEEIERRMRGLTRTPTQ